VTCFVLLPLRLTGISKRGWRYLTGRNSSIRL
jgi:hypothetical protein